MPNAYTKLFIDNQEIDLYKADELPLNITKRVNSIDGEVQGDFSRTSVTVPRTKNNKAILGDTRAFRIFRIEVDGQPSFNGIAKVRRGNTYAQGSASIKETYDINLVSNNSSWFALLGDSFLSEFTDLVVNFDEAEILLGFIADPANIDYGFTFVKLKEWANSTGAGTTLRYQLSLYESTPLLYIKPLVLAAFASIGWTVNSDFFDTDYGKKLTMPTFLPEKMPKEYNDEYLNTSVSISAPLVLPAGTAATLIYDVIDVAAPSNPIAYNVATGIYTCPLDGYYEITIEVEIPAAPVPIFDNEYGGGAFHNGVSLAPYGRVHFKFPDYPGGQTLSVTYIVFANKNDTIETGHAWLSAPAGASLTLDAARMTITGEATSVQGMPIDFKFLLTQYKFKDFIKGLICMHNLTFESDDVARTVTIEPKDLYLNQTRTPTTSELKEGFYRSDPKDYSKLIDKSKKGNYKFLSVAGTHVYKYASDSDETADWIEGINDLKIYEARFKMSSGANAASVKTKEVPFFAKTIHLLDSLARFPDTEISPQFPLVYPQNEVLDPTATDQRYDIQPRIFYFAGQRADTYRDGEIELLEFPSVNTKNPVAFMVNYNDISGLDPNMGFNNVIINGYESKGLLQRYYLQELARLDRGKTKGNYVKFNSIDYLNFTFRTKAFIDGLRFIVQTLEGFNPLIDAPTNFVFLEDKFPDSDDVDNIENSGLKGVVTTFT